MPDLAGRVTTERRSTARRAVDAYTVSETDVDLPSLIDRVAAGEQVVFTRKGQVVAGLHALTPSEALEPDPSAGPKHKTPVAREAYRRLAELRDSLPPSPVSSVDILNEMWEERENAIAGLPRR